MSVIYRAKIVNVDNNIIYLENYRKVSKVPIKPNEVKHKIGVAVFEYLTKGDQLLKQTTVKQVICNTSVCYFKHHQEFNNLKQDWGNLIFRRVVK